ncbi:hypothetical protein A5724_29345 [Mycobacterium sp. ACS1612]|uniref:hypothetical protein n=1 Tax=Mycobacterium sp. ACS1612 TaxID=1834117 RepID=UPI000800DDA4|nr:hypothetical protein [Mycobacterium sp. ACS1612]OBF27723.1 hypothetical protein A5724_29345 [Mycobacterium sp. ACS1612]
MSQETDRRIAYFLLRLAVGCSLFGRGLVRIPMLGSFHDHVTREFATSIVPIRLTRLALIVGTLTMTVFVFGRPPSRTGL